MQLQSIPPDGEGIDWAASPVSEINTDPLGLLAETILATQEYWETLPSPAPLLLREALAELLAAEP